MGAIMPGTANRRQQLEEARLRHQLELQSQQIEQVFEQHQLTAQVAGGSVQPRAISFDLQTLATGWERLLGLKQDLMTALGTSGVQISREDGSWRLQVVRPEEPPVGLLDLLALLDGTVPPTTAVLGLAEDGQPVLLNFSAAHITHVLLAGQENAGKTVLLRSLALSLALLNKQSQLQLLVIDTAERREREEGAETAVSLDPLNYLPHLLQDVVQTAEDADALLAFLVQEMTYRQTNKVAKPVIVVLIDNVVTLLRTGDNEQAQSVRQSLLRLVQRGADVGIHLVLGTSRPEARELDDLRKLDLTVRLVGRVHDAQEALVATGLPGTQAEYLLGKGDFLAVDSPCPVHFQAAFVNDYEFHLSLRQLHAQQPRLLAQPFTLRVELPSEPAVSQQPFALNDLGEVSFAETATTKNGRFYDQPPHDPPPPDVADDLLPLPTTKPNGRSRRSRSVNQPQPEPLHMDDDLLPLPPVVEANSQPEEPTIAIEDWLPVAEAKPSGRTRSKPVTLQVLDEMDDLLPLPTTKPNGRSPMAVRKRPFVTQNQSNKEQSDDGTGDAVAG